MCYYSGSHIYLIVLTIVIITPQTKSPYKHLLHECRQINYDMPIQKRKGYIEQFKYVFLNLIFKEFLLIVHDVLGIYLAGTVRFYNRPIQA